MPQDSNMMLLDMNENQYGPAPECYEVLKNVTKEMFNSYPREKPSPIIKMLSKKYDIPEEKILLGNGSEDLLKLTFQVFASDKRKMMLPYEGWSYFKSLCKEVGAEMIEYPVDELDDCWRYDMDKIFPIYAKEKPALFMACCPNNPTGNSFNPEEIEMFLKESPDTVVIWDQAYYGFTEYDLKEDVRRILENYSNVIVTRTFSKYYALAGVRIGFGFIGEKLEKVKAYNDRYLGFNRLSEEVAKAALNSEDYYRDISEKQMNDRQMYFEELSEIDGVKPFKSEATYFIAKLQPDQWKVLSEEMPKRNIKIKFIKDKEFPNYIRISLGTEEQNRACMDAIKDILG
jgi:histidinol-phosphate aminotransferase